MRIPDGQADDHLLSSHGRDRELHLLCSLLRELGTNRSAVVTVTGEPGYGQSALARWAADSAAARGIRVLHAVATPSERELPHGVVQQLLTQMAVGVGCSPEKWREQERQGRPPGMAELLMTARELPTLVVIEDDQWVDPDSLRWLNTLLRRLPDAPVALLVTRSGISLEEPGPLLNDGLRPDSLPVAKSLSVTELVLPPLTERNVAAAIRLICGSTGEERFTAAAAAISAGNPTVLCGMLRRFRDQGYEPVAARLPQLASISATVIGDHAARVLHGLPGEATAVLRALAVCGDLLDFPLVCNVAGLRSVPERKIRRALEATGFVTAVGAAGLRFRTPVVTARVLEGMSGDERADLHARAADLAYRAAVDDDDLARILLLARPIGARWAIHVLRRSFVNALHKGEYGQAVSYASRALGEPLNQAERARLELELAAAEVVVAPEAGDRRLGRIGHARGDEPAGSRARAADLRLAYGNAFDVRRSVAEAVSTADGADRDDLIALFWLADQISQHDLEPTMSEVPALPDHPEVAAQAGVRAWQLATRGEDVNATRALARSALTRRNHDGGVVLPRLAACMALRLTDVCEEAEALLDELLVEVSRDHLHISVARVLAARAELHLRSGRLDAAARDLADAERALPAADWHPALVPYLMAVRIAVDLERGLSDQARARAGAPTPNGAEDSIYWAYLLYARALVASADGDLPEAVELYQECGRRLSHRNWTNPALVPWRSMCARDCRTLGDHETALRLSREELSLARRWAVSSVLGWAELTMGLMTGGPRLARAREATRLLRDSPAGMIYQGWALVELALAERQEGNDAMSVALLNEALTLTATHPTCRASRTARWLAERLPSSSPPVPARRRAGMTRLTQAERQTAVLAGHGHSNEDIAAMSSVTTRTVEQRLRRAYEKLRISTREELRELVPLLEE